MKAVDFWNKLFSKGQYYPYSRIEMLNQDDPVLTEALNYFGDIRGKTLIDLGCGSGKTSLFFAQKGANVISIDISEIAIENLKNFCVENKLNNITPLQMSAMEIANIKKADFVFGSMILHHIEPFENFAKELSKALSLNGKAFFWENNSYSSILTWFRQNLVGKFWIPKYGDEEEFPLTSEEVEILRRYFTVNIFYPELLAFRLVSVYLLRGHLKAPFEMLDRFFFNVPFLRKYSYRQYLYLIKKDK